MKAAIATLLVLTVLIACLTGYSQSASTDATTTVSGTGTSDPGSLDKKSDNNTAASFSASFTMVTVAVAGAAMLFNNLR